MIEFKSKSLIPDGSDIGITYNVRTVHFKEHVHDFVEFVYITSGSCLHYVNGVSYEAQKGDLIYIGVGETHAFQSDSEVCSYDLYIKPEFIFTKLLSDRPDDILALSLFREFSAEISSISPCISFRGADMIEMDSLFSYARKEFDSKEAGKDSALTGYFLVILTKFLREIRKKHMASFDHQLQKVMPEIIQYIEDNYFKSLSLEELAQKSFYNPSYFSRIFKELYGKTLTEYITEKRITEAVKLLENSDMTIEEICRKIGYNDKKHFYKIFKQKMDITPGQYRRETVLRQD